MAKATYAQELKDLERYIKSDSKEDAKRPLLYPLFKDNSKIESDARADVYVEGQLIVERKSTFSQWLSGFYQTLHYQKKFDRISALGKQIREEIYRLLVDEFGYFD